MDKQLREAARLLAANPEMVKEFDQYVRELMAKGPTMGVVINFCYGGFSLSKEAEEWLEARGASANLERHDPLLVACLEELGPRASSGYSELEIVQVPAGVKYWIDDYDGCETVKF